MPLKLHCIFNEPTVLPDIIKLVEKTAHSLNSKKRSAKVEDVYAELRDNNYEIDGESVAYAYTQVKGIIGRKGFSTTAELNRFGNAGIKGAIEIANNGDIKKARLGKLSVSNAVAKGVATTFSTLNNRQDVDKSRLFQLQEMIKKAANSMLDKKGFPKPVKLSFVELLSSLFAAEDIQKTGDEAMKGKVKGVMNNIDEIWDAVKKDIAAVSKGIKDKGERAAFDGMTEAIRRSSYELLLSTKQSDDVIKGILKQIGYVKTVKKGNTTNDVVDWNAALANQENWENEFLSQMRNNGFDASQSRRIVDKLKSTYEKTLEKKAINKLNEIKKKNNLANKSKPDAVSKLIKLKNAGIFSPKNSDYLRDAFDANIPSDVADQVRKILDDYDINTRPTGSISNVEAEEVIRAVRNLLEPLGQSKMEKVVNGFSDYMALRASSTISTLFNATQNMTSGINAALFPSISAVIKTKNPKLIGNFLRSWFKTFADVSMGGVTIRDARTVNVLEQLQGRGGLSDRWTIDNAKGFFGYIKSGLNLLGQITATAADAANGTVIYNAEIIKSVKEVLKSRGMTGKEANKAIDDIVFGRAKNGKTNRQVWYEEAKERLMNQEGVVDRNVKASRIADELIWHKLITDYNITFDEVKSIQSASLSQKSKNLGHESDIFISPSTIISGVSSFFHKNADEAHKRGDRGMYLVHHLSDVIFRGVNMFVGGKANWAILSLENSPIGVGIGLIDIMRSEVSKRKGEVPLYRQELTTDNPEHLRDQLKARKAIYGRLERGFYGTVIQTLAAYAIIAALSNGGDDEDDRKSIIMSELGEAMKDPDLRRLIDKVLPTILALELSYAYDKKTNQIDVDKLSNSFFNIIPVHLNSVDGLVKLADDLVSKNALNKINDNLYYANRIKDDGERSEAKAEVIMRAIGEFLQIPYFAWLNIEKNEFKVIRSGFEPDLNRQDELKKEFKERIGNIDGATDAFLDGMGINTIIEIFKKQE